MKTILKLNGVQVLECDRADLNAFDRELLQDKYIKEGWYTANQLLKMGLLQEGKPTREVIDSPEHVEERTTEEGVIIQETIPAQTHTEYFVQSNFSIELYDDSAEIAAAAAAKADRLADLTEIKGFLTDIANSDLKPWHKKILRFLVKEAKE